MTDVRISLNSGNIIQLEMSSGQASEIEDGLEEYILKGTQSNTKFYHQAGHIVINFGIVESIEIS